MNIGIFFSAKKEGGGIFQYSLILLQALRKSKLKDNFFLFSSDKILKKEKLILNGIKNWKVIELKSYKQEKDSQKIRFYSARRFLGAIYDSLFRFSLGPLTKPEMKFKNYNIDLMLYPYPHTYCFQQKIPYIVFVHDLQHRINPNFIEVSQRDEGGKRERLNFNSLKKAEIIIAESKLGKKYIQKFYQIEPKKIKVLPYIVPPYIKSKVDQNFIKQVKNKYLLAEDFIFYPAQFWSHKNHIVIIKSLSVLKKKGFKINAVFVGDKQERWGEYERVIKLAEDLGVRDQIKHLGYVENKEMVVLYKMALCLVMPTFFGPSNIPPLEAFYLKCPVISSDIEGIRSQIGKAGLLVNPRKEKDVAQAILRILKEPKLRKKLIKRGEEKIKKWKMEDFTRKLENIIKEAKSDVIII